MSEPKILQTNRLYNGRVFNLVVHEVEYPSGNRSVREIAQHPGGAVVVAILPDDTVLLVRQYRFPVGRELYELPAGKLDKGEDPMHCAARELEEETGYVAASLHKLMAMCTTPGFSDEILHIFLASGLQPSPHGQQLEEGELSLRLERIPFARTLEMIDEGTIVDGKTIAGLLFVDRLRKSGKQSGV